MNKLNWVLLVIGTVAITGCVETKDEFTVNPDGSGKVIHEITFVSMDLGMMGEAMGGEASFEMTGDESSFEITDDESSFEMDSEPSFEMDSEPSFEMPGIDSSFNMMGGEPSDPQAQLKESVKEILSQSSGVDTWEDISCKLTDDGRMYFKGTAYFPDINELNIHTPGFSSDMKLHFTRDISGEITIEFKGQEQGEEDEAVETPTTEISEADLDKEIKEAKLQYNQMKPMMQGFLSTLKTETILHLPGGIKEISNFEKVDDRTVRWLFDGAKLIEAMDKMMQDEDWLKEQIRAGKDPTSDGPRGDLEKLLGDVPPRVVLAGGAQQLFDYDAEVTAAKANYESMLKALGLEETEPARPAIGDVPPFPGFGEVTPTASVRVTGEMNVKVGGVRLVRYSDFERGIMPLGQTDGYTLSLIGELPAPAIKVSGGRIEKATTDTGKSLLPKNQWGRKIKFPRLAKDKKTVVFDVELLLPDKDVEGLEELSGTLEYLTADASRAVDLGIMDFKVGAKGKGLGTVIRSIGKDPWQKSATVLSLRLSLRPEVLESAEFFAQDGTKLDVSKRGYESIAGTTTLKFSIKGKLPPKGRIVLNLFEGLKKNEIPFEITEISLTGQSLW